MYDETLAPRSYLRIGHDDITTGSGGTHAHLHPVTGDVQATIPLAGRVEIDQAVSRAAAAFDEWRAWKPEARRDVLTKLGLLMRDNIDEFARLAALDNGVPLAHGRSMATRAAEWALYYAGWADKLDGQQLATFGTRDMFSYTMPEPYGIIGVIVTWNGPLLSLGMKAVPALAAGNCVVIKPAELTPFVPDHWAKLAREAGIPDGVLSVVAGTPEAGEALVADPRVGKITFTGGPIAARKILKVCAESFKPAVLELGGKSPSIVFPDVDVESVAERAIANTMGIMAGQGCSLPTRLILHADIHDRVVERVVEIAKGYKVGDPFDPSVKVGPIINKAGCDRIMGMLDRLREAGSGRILLGGNRCGGALEGKNFIEPTIVVDVDPDCEIAQTEVFGPVLCIFKFSTEQEAVALANNTAYGLAAHVQTNDLKRAHRVAEKIAAGGVYINGALSIPHFAPFGGIGLSGYGREGGRVGIDEFLRYKTVSIA
jgi:aldehyde dehydrogenase (NAD+)